jgi:XTP/dITP diphosphohydrolase
VLRIVLASGNAGKCREFQQVLQPAGVELTLQKSLGISDADETGLTFVENAIIKARHAAQLSGLPALADDSGLEVDALKGAPGIYSARFSGIDATDERNNQKLLEQLRDIPDAQRTARFHCVLVLMRHAADPTPIICQGSWGGRIIDAPRGDNGFGYDPLFFVDALNSTSAQLAPETKNRVSHRGQALALLLQTLQQQPHLLTALRQP